MDSTIFVGILLANVGILLANLKLYTEILKDHNMTKRAKSEP